MDPSVNLREQRKIARKLRDTVPDSGLARDLGERLAELVLALDEWLCKGGMLPRQWL